MAWRLQNTAAARRIFLCLHLIARDMHAAGRERIKVGILRSSAMRAMVTIAALLPWSAPTGAQVEIRSLTGTVEGHEVGGVTIDMIGNVYAADFGDIVWKLTPEGQRTTFVAGLYGTSGNAIDNQGNLLLLRRSSCSVSAPAAAPWTRADRDCREHRRGEVNV